MREKLLQLRRELRQAGAAGDQSSGIVELDQARVGRLTRMDALQAQAMSQASARRRSQMLLRVDAALRRIDDGSFGLCLSCDRPINARRLDFDPAVTLCIDCAAAGESA